MDEEGGQVAEQGEGDAGAEEDDYREARSGPDEVIEGDGKGSGPAGKDDVPLLAAGKLLAEELFDEVDQEDGEEGDEEGDHPDQPDGHQHLFVRSGGGGEAESGNEEQQGEEGLHRVKMVPESQPGKEFRGLYMHPF